MDGPVLKNCRVCHSRKMGHELTTLDKHLSDKKNSPTYLECLRQYTKLKIPTKCYAKWSYPQSICKKCCKVLQTIDELLAKMSESEEVLEGIAMLNEEEEEAVALTMSTPHDLALAPNTLTQNCSEQMDKLEEQTPLNHSSFQQPHDQCLNITLNNGEAVATVAGQTDIAESGQTIVYPFNSDTQQSNDVHNIEYEVDDSFITTPLAAEESTISEKILNENDSSTENWHYGIILQCTMCKYSCVYRGMLVQHYRNEHAIEPTAKMIAMKNKDLNTKIDIPVPMTIAPEVTSNVSDILNDFINTAVFNNVNQEDICKIDEGANEDDTFEISDFFLDFVNNGCFKNVIQENTSKIEEGNNEDVPMHNAPDHTFHTNDVFNDRINTTYGNNVKQENIWRIDEGNNGDVTEHIALEDISNTNDIVNDCINTDYRHNAKQENIWRIDEGNNEDVPMHNAPEDTFNTNDIFNDRTNTDYCNNVKEENIWRIDGWIHEDLVIHYASQDTFDLPDIFNDFTNTDYSNNVNQENIWRIDEGNNGDVTEHIALEDISNTNDIFNNCINTDYRHNAKQENIWRIDEGNNEDVPMHNAPEDTFNTNDIFNDRTNTTYGNNVKQENIWRIDEGNNEPGPIHIPPDCLNTTMDNVEQETILLMDQDNNNKALTFSCKLCTFETDVSMAMEMHVQQGHKIKQGLENYYLMVFKCQHCTKPFKSEKALNTHITLKHDKTRPIRGTSAAYCCSNCDKAFSYKSSLLSHEKACCPQPPPSQKSDTKGSGKDAEIKHQCDICYNFFKTRQSLLIHAKRHLEREHECKTCGRTYINSTELRQHMERVHGFKTKAVCPECKEQFTNKNKMREHLQRYHLKRSYKCSYCSFEAKSKSTVRKHEFQHKGKPFKCDRCKKEYITHKMMRRHMIAVHGIEMSDDELATMFRKNSGYTCRSDAFQYVNDDESLIISEIEESDVNELLKEDGILFEDVCDSIFADETVDVVEMINE